MNSIDSVSQDVNSGSFTLTTSSPTSAFGVAQGTISSISSVDPNIIVSATSDDALEVRGDVKINGKIKCASLEERLAEIEARIGILQVRPDLEERVDELKEIGDQYRAMVKNLDAKQALWDLLAGNKTS